MGWSPDEVVVRDPEFAQYAGEDVARARCC